MKLLNYLILLVIYILRKRTGGMKFDPSTHLNIFSSWMGWKDENTFLNGFWIHQWYERDKPELRDSPLDGGGAEDNMGG